MRFLALLFMTATLTAPAIAASLTGVWRLVEVNSLPMQETPPYGQLNRKEIYTNDGKLLAVRPDVPSSAAEPMGTYEVHDGIRVFTAPSGEQAATPIQWIDDDHFFFEFNPGECWYYARVTGDNAAEQQWEPRSVAVVRTTEDGSGPTLRNFPYDVSDDSAMPWTKRVVGAWETIRVGGGSVSGPDTPPYGMPNDRILIGADGTMRKVHANGEADPGDEGVHIKVESGKITVVEAGFEFHYWFNRWGQLVFEQPGLQTVFKRISLDARKAPAGPIVVVLLSGDREEPRPTAGKIVEVKKTAAPAMPVSSVKRSGAEARPVARPKPTFTKPHSGGSFAIDLALEENEDALRPENEVNQQARKSGLGSTSDILEVNEADKFALIRGDAIDSDFAVPFGWHVADNGDRMLVFDANHFVEVKLDMRPVKSGAKALLQAVLDERLAAQPDLKSQLSENADGSALLILQNYREKEEIRTRSYVTHDIGQAKQLLVAEISAGPGDMVRGLNLSEALFRNLKYSP